MPSSTATPTPGLISFLVSVSTEPVETSVELFIALLKRRQIRGSKSCAIATASLLRRVISLQRQADAPKLIQRVSEVGKRLTEAAPRELAIGNLVRRVLGLIRDEQDENRGEGGDHSGMSSDFGSEPVTPRTELPHSPMLGALSPSNIASRRELHGASALNRPPLLASQTTTAGTSRPFTSMFSILSHPTMKPSSSDASHVRSGTSTPTMGTSGILTDLRAEVLEGISEIIDELHQADEQIANYALEHIHPQETVFTYSASATVQRFLLKAASKRKFTVIHAESYPNNHHRTHAMLTGAREVGKGEEEDDFSAESFSKPLTNAGITVIMVPDSAIFAIMSRCSKVILGAHVVLSNGSAVAASGSKAVTVAAKFHRVPVIVLAATYKMSMQHPYDPYDLMESGDVGKVIPYQDAELRRGLADRGIINPLYDFIESKTVDLYVTNLGGVSAGYLYRVIRDQYRDEDQEL